MFSTNSVDKTQISDLKYNITELNNFDQLQILNYTYSVIAHNFATNSGKLNLTLRDFKYDWIFVTFYTSGNVRCSQGSSNSNLKRALDTSIINCLNDERFGEKINANEINNLNIDFDILYNKRRTKNPVKDIEPGIHSIELKQGQKRAIFKASVQIAKQFDTATALLQLCKKAQLNNDCYKKKNTSIYIYDTITFNADIQGNIVDLYRYNLLLTNLTNEDITHSLDLVIGWYQQSIDEEGLLEYEYIPSRDSYSTSNNHIRKLLSLWAYSELRLRSNLTIRPIMDKTITYYLNFTTKKDNFTYLDINGDTNIANSAFIILTLLNENASIDILKGFGDGILYQQRSDGSYKIFFGTRNDTGIEFYPGEAMLSLIKLYKRTGDRKYLDSVHKAYYYYSEYWDANKNTIMVSWHSQACKLLYDEIKDSNISSFVFRMNDWRITKQQMLKSEYEDQVGGGPIGNPTFSTSTLMEGINEAYALAVSLNDEEHINRYRDSIEKGTRFILLTQYNEYNTYYLKNKNRALGGFRFSLINNNQRIDYAQHAVFALIKAHDNMIFG
ncbi:MAG: AMMECR1 domain-containing protein [archaeon]